MRICIWMVALICMTCAGGCSPCVKTSSEGAQTLIVSGASHMESTGQGKVSLTVEGCSLTGEELTLEYRVANTSRHDIWICTSQSILSGENSMQSRDVRIADGTLWIRRKANVEQNCLVDGTVCAGYRRLSPGQTRLHTIVLPLPVGPFSIVYSPSREFSEVVLRRIVIEVGYFDEDLRALIQQQCPQYAEFLFSIASYVNDPNVVGVLYLDQDKWDGLSLEKTACASIADVEIPGRIGAWIQLPTGEIVGQRNMCPQWEEGEGAGAHRDGVSEAGRGGKR